jgi:biopolymer transport protein TolQ
MFSLNQIPQHIIHVYGNSALSNVSKAFEHFDFFAWGVVVLIVLFSMAGWAVIIAKALQILRLRSQDRKFLDDFGRLGGSFTKIYDAGQRRKESPCAKIFMAGYAELRAIAPVQSERLQLRKDMLPTIQRVFDQVVAREILDLERHMIVLATTASVCPFLGLLGTVWGLLDSFWSMAETGSAGIATVAPGIAGALVTTIFGLFAAIPAVIGYNWHQNSINEVILEMEEFSGRNLSILERNVVPNQSTPSVEIHQGRSR